MKKPETFDEIVHVQKLGVGQYKFISFDEKHAQAAEDLADVLNRAVTAFGETFVDFDLYNKAIAALKKAGYTE